jgi:cysteine desulfurase
MPYFDYNATTPLHPAALEAWRETTAQAWHNPSSPYRAAARAHALIEEAREQLAALAGGTPRNYVFTAGATEANNAVFAHFAQHAPAAARAIVSAIEHPSVLEPAQAWFPGRLELLPVNAAGVVDLTALEENLRRGGVAVVSLMAANNETGVLQPWAEAARLCREHGVLFHCDAAQWLGKLPAGELARCDFVTGSAHKFGGPKGVGFLKVPADIGDFHILRGGAQEHDRRAGTENLPGIRAMVAALAARAPELSGKLAGWESARAKFAAGLREAVPGAVIVGENAPHLWNTVMFVPPRHANTRWVAALDRRDFQVSTGSACATGREGPSHVLAAMGVDALAARRAVRISAGWETTAADGDALLAALAAARVDLDGSDDGIVVVE